MYRNSKRNAVWAITQGQVGVQNDPFDDLAIAVVRLAAEDYRSYHKRKKRLEKRMQRAQTVKQYEEARESLLRCDWEIKKLEQFFKSDWCFALSGGTNIAILERLQKEQEE